MKKLIYFFTIILAPSLVYSQNPSKNYVKTTVYQVNTQNGNTNATTSESLSNDDKIESINYFDDLGRPLQSIAKQAGGNHQDIITPIVYDHYGRQTRDYLPYSRTTSGLNFDASLVPNENGDILILNSFYNNKNADDFLGMPINEVNPFSEKRLENSPLNRILEQAAPGKDWSLDSDHTIKFAYQTNTVNEVEMFSVIFPTLNTEQPQLYYEGFYAANELYKTITKDENWQPNANPLIINKHHTTEEFKDKLGRVILKRTYDSQEVKHDTHYVYDDFGNLTYVLSPKGSDLILSDNTYESNMDKIECIKFIPLNKMGEPIISGCRGDVTFTIDAINLTIDVNFSLQFSSAINLKNGPIALLNKKFPNLIIGTISTGGANYTLSTQDGYLYIVGSGVLTSVVQTFTVDLPTQSVVTGVLDDLCYQYRYDKRNRLIEKKIPQKGWEYIVYDKLDRPVLTQDAILRASNDWLFTKYDAFDRVVYTGRFKTTSLGNNRISLQNTFNNQSNLNESRTTTATLIDGVNVYYSKIAYPTSINKLYTVNYYDSYTSDVTSLFPNPTTALGQTISTSTKSLSTASKVRVLDTESWITSVTYYDDKARPVYVASKNDYLNTTDVVMMQLDFMGKVIKTESSHVKGTNQAIVVTDDFTYDHTGRLLTQKQKIGNGAQELIVKNSYDELGQLENKKVGNTEATPLQTVDYSYNIRGWLKQINNPQSLGNDLFAFAINYNTTTLGQSNDKLYNGNISETIWKTANDTGSNTTRGYAYQYDALNRLNTANMSINTGSGFALASGYHENGLQYDKNGNIMSLQRTGATTVFDNLSYIYNGNQLSKVTDAVTNQQTEGFIDGNTVGNDYTYDANGNMKTDKNKGITSIIYNHLNLPTQVSFGAINKIKYVYDATGVKLKKRVEDGSSNVISSLYAGNYIYEESEMTMDYGDYITIAIMATLKFFSHPEGYIEPKGQGNYDYIYQYKDHLGNVRLTYADSDNNGSIDASTEIISEKNYYPFGLVQKGYNNVVTSNSNSVGEKFQYANKELEVELGLNTVSYGWRDYDPALGRFNKADRFAEKYYDQTPYHFTKNNPLFFKEMQGDSIWVFNETVKSAGHLGTHAFIRVKTKSIDMVIELTAPSKGRKTGTPSIKEFDPKYFKGGRGRVSKGLLIEPTLDNPNERMEKGLLSFFKHFSETNEKGEFINLSEYNPTGPNSNGFVKALIYTSTGVEVGLNAFGWGEDDTEGYDKEMYDFISSLDAKTANFLLSVVEKWAKDAAQKQEDERKKQEEKDKE